ncbi:MAG: hypothetical protein DYG88_08900 [Chloroflexi bacterium CFX4]|nr:hypothetical protein [Chloroflexi bacterium CFX4]MDL1922268.1 hypothetical protein [Chloroflexi bacterium CFX3]
MLLAGLLLASIVLSANVAQARPHGQSIPASYQQVAENDLFQLYVDFTTLAFKVRDKRTDYVWHSGIDALAEGDRLNRSWQAFAQSGISLEYLDERAINKRISITNSAHTLTVTPVPQGVLAQLAFLDYEISLEISLQLEADGVRVAVPFASIREGNPKSRLGLLYLYPFFGATRGSSTDGYMFLPDGIGSLIPFADSTKAKNMFYGRYYGADLGMIGIMPFNVAVNPPLPISFPVFGMVHGEGQNAFLAVVEQGAAYGELQAHPAGILTNFNFLYNAFIYNQSYFQATNRSGAGVTTLQRQPNAFDVVMHYRFLIGEAASYVGMARSYQRYLVDAGRLHQHTDSNPNIGIRLEFLGGDKERVLFWDRFVPMTTLRQMREILDRLQVANPQVIYYGWQPLGATTMPPHTLALESGLGNLDELRAITEKVAAADGYFWLYLDPQAAFGGEGGYSPRNDVAMAITGVSLEGYSRTYNHYFTVDALQRRYTDLTSDIAAQLRVGLALDNIGSMLYTDFRSTPPFSRESALSAYQRLLGESPVRLSFYRPNDYMFGMAAAYYDMPLGNNGYIYTTESVPFLPIVLSGYVPYYGSALNFSSDLQEDLLRHVDFGIYPSYFLTYEATANMLNTRSSWIYTSSYAQWGGQVRQTYQWMNALLAPVRGQSIVARQRLAVGVFATTYANGRQIIVNYSTQPFTYGGQRIEARDALLWENAP